VHSPVWLIGPGALGCALAQKFSESNLVRLIGPRPPVDSAFHHYWCGPELPSNEAPEWIWLTCKSASISSTLTKLRTVRLPPTTLLVAPQNGFGVSEELEQHLLPLAWARTAVWFGAKFEDSRLSVSAPPHRITVAGSEKLSDRLSSSGFTVEQIHDRDAAHLLEWKKGFTSLALNGLLALEGHPNGKLCESPDLQAQARTLQAEAFQVFHALGLSGITPEEAWLDLLRTARETALNRNSMLQDLEAGRPLELPRLNGWLLKKSAPLQLHLPSHHRLVAQLEARANSLQPKR